MRYWLAGMHDEGMIVCDLRNEVNVTRLIIRRFNAVEFGHILILNHIRQVMQRLRTRLIAHRVDPNDVVLNPDSITILRFQAQRISTGFLARIGDAHGKRLQRKCRHLDIKALARVVTCLGLVQVPVDLEQFAHLLRRHVGKGVDVGCGIDTVDTSSARFAGEVDVSLRAGAVVQGFDGVEVGEGVWGRDGAVVEEEDHGKRDDGAWEAKVERWDHGGFGIGVVAGEIS